MIRSIATHLPPWSDGGGGRVVGPDEDAITLAVAAGRAAIDAAAAPVTAVQVVTRELPLLEGGSAAALVAGLGLADGVDVVERVGGAPEALAAIGSSPDGTVVIGVDVSAPAGAAAVVLGPGGAMCGVPARVQRSLPLRVRSGWGELHVDEDARLQRERGVRASLEAAALAALPDAAAGLSSREARAIGLVAAPVPTLGASAPGFALAWMVDADKRGVLAAFEQANLTTLAVGVGPVSVVRREPVARPVPARAVSPGPEIKISLAAYDRAFASKLRWEAGHCESCGLLAFPERYRCLGCGTEGSSVPAALTRSGSVYTTTTIHVPVPGLASPYSLAVVELDDVDVRVLVHITDSPPGEVDIGDRGDLVLRRVATRSGVPDYGYAFTPSAIDEEIR